MPAMGGISDIGYRDGMPPRKPAIARPPRRRDRARPKVYPNRIHELTRREGMNYADVGEKVGAHEVTIAKLATGKIQLTQEWMHRLAKVFQVTPAAMIEAPAQGMRRVRVRGALKAGAWHEGEEWPPDDQYDVFVPDEPTLRRQALYAGEVQGESMNRLYPPGSVVVLSRIEGASASEVATDRRYHVRVTRGDGMVEETIKTLVRGEDGRLWLRPESSHPEHQQWIPLDGSPDVTVELIGRARFSVRRED